MTEMIDAFDIVSNDDTQDYFNIEVQIEQSKLKEIEKYSKVTLKDGENIKRKWNLLNLSRKNILYFGKFLTEQPIEIRNASGNEAISLVNHKQISERLQFVKTSDRGKIKYIHLSTIQIMVRSTYTNIDSPIQLMIIDNRIKSNNIRERIIGMINGNLKYGTVKFNVSLQFAIPLITQSFDQSIGILYRFQRQDLMDTGDYPFSMTYAVSYALSNSHHSIEYENKDRIEIDSLFKNTSTRPLIFKDGNKHIGTFKVNNTKRLYLNEKDSEKVIIPPIKIFKNEHEEEGSSSSNSNVLINKIDKIATNLSNLDSRI